MSIKAVPTKTILRSRMRTLLTTQKEEDRTRKSAVITNKLLRTELFRKARNVMAYIAFGGEVDTKAIIEAARRLGKKIAVPVCRTDHTMVACALPDKGALVRGIHGTCEPAVTQIMQVRDIDVVLVPGIAFDREGNRLGRGKGCYDRFLCTLQPHTRTVGLAFDFQIVSSLPVSACDMRVDRVLSA